MALLHNAAQPLRQTGRLGFPGRAETTLRDLSHISLLVFAAVAVAAGVVAVTSLSSEFGAGIFWSFIAVVVLFPIACGLLLKEVRRVRKRESQVRCQQTAMGLLRSAKGFRDISPAGLLIVSSDMRIQFANQKFLDSMLRRPEEVSGREVREALSGGGLEEQALTLLRRPGPAASCCFDTVIHAGSGAMRPVHITLTRIAPQQGEGSVLVIIEDLLPERSSQLGEPVEGFIF